MDQRCLTVLVYLMDVTDDRSSSSYSVTFRIGSGIAHCGCQRLEFHSVVVT